MAVRSEYARNLRIAGTVLGAVLFLIVPTTTGTIFEFQSSIVDRGFFPYVDFDLDAQGNAHIVYGEQNIDQLFYKTNRTGSWGAREFINAMSDIGTQSVSVASSAGGDVHVAYSSPTADNFAYATNINGQWSSQDLRSSARSLSLDLNSNGTPRVAFHSVSGSGSLYYASQQVNSWSFVKVDSSHRTGRYPDLVVDSADQGHIVYYDFNSNSLRYASNAGGNWNYETFIANARSSGHIDCDSQDNIYITYNTNNRIWIAKQEYHTWHTTPITPLGSHNVDWDFTIAEDGTIYMVYFDEITDHLNLVSGKNDQFEIQALYWSGRTTYGPHIEIHDNLPHILFWDRTGNEYLIYLKVIPEPASLCLLVFGTLGLCKKRKNNFFQPRL